MISELYLVLNLVDGWLASLLPLAVRLAIWGALAGSLSMIIYAKLSPQASIAKMKTKTRSLQRAMLNMDLVFADFMRLSKENLKTSLRLFFTVLGPAVVSAIPVILLAIWIHTCLAYEAPPTPDDLEVMTEGRSIELQLLNYNELNEISKNEIQARNFAVSEEIVIKIDNKVIYSGNPLSPPMPVIHKRRWWNVILDSPAGYIVKDAPIDSMKLNISRKQIIKWMPGWASGWEVPFFIFVLIANLGIKYGFRIE